MALAQQHSRAFLWLLCGIWGYTLTLCGLQAGLCEWRAKGLKSDCGTQWQLAIVTAVGMGQTVFSLFSPPPGSTQGREAKPSLPPTESSSSRKP